MKTVIKEFYVSDDFFKLVNEGMDINEIFELNCDLKDKESYFHKNKILISWKEPEKKIEITESQLDDLFIRAHNKVNQSKGLLTLKPYAEDLMDEIKKLFGASDE